MDDSQLRSEFAGLETGAAEGEETGNTGATGAEDGQATGGSEAKDAGNNGSKTGEDQ